MKLLALDTATEICSVAVWSDGLVVARESPAGMTASALILELAAAALAEAKLSLSVLDVIAFGRGPGGFTGVRLAASVTQGLAFAAQLPVVPVSSLRAVAQRALAGQGADARVLVCQDARMGEVYWALFELRDGHAVPVGAEAVSLPARVALPAGWQGDTELLGAGTGFAVYPQLSTLARPLVDCLPRAAEIAQLAAHDGLAEAVSAEQALPVYLRNDVATPA
jgi:tRNA threonylcarbamoyladenosine biosynthesis protein TsaB